VKELFDWLGRFEAAEASGQPTSLTERLHRVCATDALDFDGSVVRLVDAQQEVYPFGTFPGRLSVLSWPSTASEPQFLEDQAIAAQLGAVLTLATNRRVEVAASDLALTMEGTTQRTFLSTAPLLDRSLLGSLPAEPQDGFDHVIHLLYGLQVADREVVGAAVELHYTATLLFDVEPNAAYAMVIAGIERLSREYGSAPASWARWERAEALDGVFAAIGLTDAQMESLRVELLKDRHLRLRQTFASYVAQRLPTDFWERELEDFTPAITMMPDGVSRFSGMTAEPSIPITRVVPTDAEVLRRRLLRSYDARSSYVHDGRRRSSLSSTMAQIVGQEAEAAAPIEFAGLRAVLRALIFTELESRSHEGSFPQLLWMHPSDGGSTETP
jgi:hypothetical protein